MIGLSLPRNIWARISGWWNQRNLSPTSRGYWFLRGFGGGVQSSTGLDVNRNSAVQAMAVHSVVSLLSDSVAMLPLKVFRKTTDSEGREIKEPAPGHPLADILANKPNEFMTSFTWRETLMRHAVLMSNAYSQIIRNEGGDVVAIMPIVPENVRPPRLDRGELRYMVRIGDAEEVPMSADQILHVRALSWTGLVGRSRLDIGREALGLSLGLERFAATFFGNNAKPNAVIEHPGVLGAEGTENLKESWEDFHRGMENQFRVGVLEEGAKLHEYGNDMESAQGVESRKFQVTEVSRWGRVPPAMVNDLERSTFSNHEQQSTSFVTYSLDPWLVRIESEINMKLFTKRDRELGFFAEFNRDALLRADTASRHEAYKDGITTGWMTRNEARAKENMNPLDGLDDPLVPLNMGAVDQDGNVSQEEPTDD